MICTACKGKGGDAMYGACTDCHGYGVTPVVYLCPKCSRELIWQWNGVDCHLCGYLQRY